VVAALTIEDRTATGRPTGSITLTGLSDRITLRELIRTRVREEVARYNLKPLAIFQGLVQPEDSDQTRDGFQMRNVRQIDWQRQADTAIRSFGRNGFFVLVDGKQVMDLDAELDLASLKDVGFIRLIQLIGG
jgi:hypothetical protein